MPLKWLAIYCIAFTLLTNKSVGKEKQNENKRSKKGNILTTGEKSFFPLSLLGENIKYNNKKHTFNEKTKGRRHRFNHSDLDTEELNQNSSVFRPAYSLTSEWVHRC